MDRASAATSVAKPHKTAIASTLSPSLTAIAAGKTTQPVYVVRRTADAPVGTEPWKHPCWKSADLVQVRDFHPTSSDHRPVARVRMLYDNNAIYVRFHVNDRYVRCAHTKHQSVVSRDTCVECFLEPAVGKGYFNFEMNCGGTMLLYYIEDATRLGPGVFAKFTVLPDEDLRKITLDHSLPSLIEQEIEHPVEWWLMLTVPLSVLERYAGKIADPSRQIWRGNFFKCADQTSHPHWASWTPLGENLRFHQPDKFGWLHFA
jgi:hypothetical protein